MIPPLDPAGLLAAVLTAAIFTLAIVYVVRSKATDLETPLSAPLLGVERAGRELFAGVLMESRSSAHSLAISVGLHLLVLLSAPLLPRLFPEQLQFDFRRYNAKIMEFRIPTPLLYSPPEEPKPDSPKRRPSAPAQTGKAEPKMALARAGADASRRPQLQLPSSLRTPNKDVIIQPDQPPDVAVAMPYPLPRTLLWAQGPSPLEPSRVVGAPKRPDIPTFSLPHADPRIQTPNRQINISDLQIGPGPILTFRDPQLPVPPANVSPLALAGEGAGELPASALLPGSPMNLLSLVQTPAPRTNAYLIEAGNRLAEPSDDALAIPGLGGQGPGGRGAGGIGSGPDKGGQADLLRAAGNGDGGESGASGGSSSASDSRVRSATQAAPHGNMGVIIVQQSAQEAVLEGGEALSGQPVYTVFFEVPGAPRRWILQYCVPGSAARQFVIGPDGVIHILPRRSIQPPYPVDRLPLDLGGVQGDLRRLVVFATINEQGDMDNIRVVRGTGQEIDGAAVAALRRWSFRPALRGEDPVAVEALFGIPLQ